MWTYSQSSGALTFYDCAFFSRGYSGKGEDKNEPESQEIHNRGPIPRGRWQIHPPINTPEHGPFVLPLSPLGFTEVFGRSGFLIHGDSKTHPGEASEGCIILDRNTRETIWNSADHEIEVVA